MLTSLYCTPMHPCPVWGPGSRWQGPPIYIPSQPPITTIPAPAWDHQEQGCPGQGVLTASEKEQTHVPSPLPYSPTVGALLGWKLSSSARLAVQSEPPFSAPLTQTHQRSAVPTAGFYKVSQLVVTQRALTTELSAWPVSVLSIKRSVLCSFLLNPGMHRWFNSFRKFTKAAPAGA